MNWIVILDIKSRDFDFESQLYQKKFSKRERVKNEKGKLTAKGHHQQVSCRLHCPHKLEYIPHF